MEGRALFEAAYTLAMLPWFTPMEHGDGHAVIVYPGFGCGGDSTALLRSFITKAGYSVYCWGQGRNVGPSVVLEQCMRAQLSGISEQHEGKVSLVGWSLGGLYARALANDDPQLVRRVITLGSPHLSRPDDTILKQLFERISPTKISDLTEEDFARIRNTPPVPVTSIYSRTDGVVAWQDCLNEAREDVENVEVQGSHSGLSHNHHAIRVVLERLAR
jgi:esterase/lipase